MGSPFISASRGLAIDSVRTHAFNDRDMEIMERYARVMSSIIMKHRLSLYQDRYRLF